MSERTRPLLVILCSGIILANVIVASSNTFQVYAPLQMSSTWLLLASWVSGAVLGFVVQDDGAAMLYGVILMALIAAAGFTGTLLAVSWLGGSRLLDIILLYAVQQAFPRVMSISVFGYGGTFSAILVRLVSGRL